MADSEARVALGGMATRMRMLLTLLMFAGCVPSPRPPAPAAPASSAEGSAEGSTCQRATLALQVLGSGGPIPDDNRASSGYLIWRRGKAIALVDVGGGVFLRFGEAGARIEDLQVVAIGHLHADHVGDLPALLKGGYFAERKRALPIVGPSGNDRFPAVDAHLRALLDADRGAYRYLAGYLDGEGLFPLDVRVVDAAKRVPAIAFEGDGLALQAVGIHHGVIPSLGFIVEVEGKRIAFSGDQSADNQAFEQMVAGADLLVVHHALPDRGFEGVTHLHRTPTQIAALASGARVGRIVLSHNMQRALRDLEGCLATIAGSYSGRVEVADDLSCYVLQP